MTVSVEHLVDERAKVAPEKLALTELRLERLPRPAKGARYVYDRTEPGLAVRFTKGAVSFVFSKWHNGRPGRITIGKVGAVSLRDARAVAAGYRGDMARGIDVFARAQEASRAPRPTTLAEAYAAHVARPDMRPSTLRDYASLWRLVPARMRGRALTAIAQAELVTLHAKVGEEHPRTANKLIALISVLASQNGRRADNPASGIRRFREDPRQRVLTVEEMRRLRDALESERAPWRSFFTLLMLTGARRGALARMQWTDLDFGAAVWRIPAVWSKNRKVLTVPLTSEAVEILTQMHAVRGASPWVFPAQSKAGHVTEPLKAWRRVAKRAAVEGALPHDLRRTLGTTVAADGAGAAIISAVLGHISPQSAKSYVHLSAEMARGAVEKAAARIRRGE